MGHSRGSRRVLVATDNRRCPVTALEHAAAVAGDGGEVVLASVIVVPVTQPLDANLERPVGQACGVLEKAEVATKAMPGSFDTRIVRARSFSKGVLEVLGEERFDLLVLEQGRDGLKDGPASQTAALLEKAAPTVVLVRPSG
jgi:Universal stress protein family